MKKLELWQQYEYLRMKPGLERIGRFLRRTGEPQTRYAAVHIAGTNGKGSTARMLADILARNGYRTGLYTSPHLLRVNERIQINGAMLPDRSLERLFNRYEQEARRCRLSYFEMLTALAFHYFAEQKVAVAVLETGLGGRFDATNVVERPLACIITDIDYDHQQLLGKRLGSIAAEKAGIIKKGCPVISGVERPSAAKVIAVACAGKKAALRLINRDFKATIENTCWARGFQEITYTGSEFKGRLSLSLLGEYQTRNAALALAAAETIIGQGYGLRFSRVKEALRAARWPGRFDVRGIGVSGTAKTLVLDGAHNPGGMERFVATWEKSPFARREGLFIFGALKDKNVAGMVRRLSAVVKRVITVPVRSLRTMPAEAQRRLWERYLPAENIEQAASFEEALALTGTAKTVGVTGSLYLVGEALQYLQARDHATATARKKRIC